jgi:hypothetical protein
MSYNNTRNTSKSDSASINRINVNKVLTNAIKDQMDVNTYRDGKSDTDGYTKKLGMVLEILKK